MQVSKSDELQRYFSADKPYDINELYEFLQF